MPKIKEETLSFSNCGDSTGNTCDVATQTLFMPPILNPIGATKNMQIVYPSPRIKKESPKRLVLPIKNPYSQSQQYSTLYSLQENKLDSYQNIKSDLVDCRKLPQTDLSKLRDSKTTTASQITTMPIIGATNLLSLPLQKVPIKQKETPIWKLP